MKCLIATYGTFRKGFPFENYLKHMRLLGSSEEVEIQGVQMYVFGQAPGAVITGNPDDKITVELIEDEMPLDEWDAVLVVLDIVEGIHDGLYKRESVDTHKGKAILYTWAGELPEDPVRITDWAEWSVRPEEEKAQLLGKDFIILI